MWRISFVQRVNSLTYFFSLTSVYLFIVGVEGYCCVWSHSITTAYSVGIPWTRDKSVAEASTCTTYNLTHLLEAVHIILANCKMQIRINSEVFALGEKLRKSPKSDRKSVRGEGAGCAAPRAAESKGRQNGRRNEYFQWKNLISALDKL
jgi:hypothetical protein